MFYIYVFVFAAIVRARPSARQSYVDGEKLSKLYTQHYCTHPTLPTDATLSILSTLFTLITHSSLFTLPTHTAHSTTSTLSTLFTFFHNLLTYHTLHKLDTLQSIYPLDTSHPPQTDGLDLYNIFQTSLIISALYQYIHICH